MRLLALHLELDESGERLLLAAYLSITLLFLFTTGEDAQRLWAAIAVGPYALALVVAIATRGQPWASLIAALGAVLVPIIVLVLADIGQPEVGVVHDGGLRLIEHGTPYLLAPTHLYDFRPYLPAMFLMGLGPGILGDVRFWGALILLVGVLAQFGWTRDDGAGRTSATITAASWAGRRIGLVLAMPVVALALCASGIDSPQAGLTLLALAAYRRQQWVAAGIGAGVAVALKPLGLVAVAVLVLAAYRAGGFRSSFRLFGAAAATAGALIFPVAVISPSAMFVNSVQFPAGAAALKSPAASPFPGVLLREAGTPSWISIGSVLLVALSYLLFCKRWRAAETTQVAAQMSLGFVLAFAVAPYSRFGYMMLPALIWSVATISDRAHVEAEATHS